MRKQDIIAREKKQSILDFIEKNNINVSHREFARITQRHKLENLIYSIEKIKIGDLYYSGLIDISSDSHSFCKLSNSYYECEECKNIYKLFFKTNKEKNIDSNKYLCQKCSCKYTNTRNSKKIKSSETARKRWREGDHDNLKEKFSLQFSRLNKTIIRDINLNKSSEEKESIKNKKKETWLKRDEKERKEINKKRSTAFSVYNNEKHIESRLKINDLLDNTSLNELRDLLLKSDRVKIYEEITGDNWKSLRQEAVKIYNYECPRCHKNIKENPFNLHHSIPFSFKQENSDLIVLCHSCHMKVEAKFNKKFSETRDIYLSRDYSLEDIDDLFYYRDSKNAQRQ